MSTEFAFRKPAVRVTEDQDKRSAVRLLAKVTIPLQTGDEASKSGTLPRTMQAAMQTLKPESAYFFEEDGKRECLFVFNLDFVTLLKPLFPDLDASFHVTPVMNATEFEQALGDATSRQPVVGESDFLTDIHPEAKTTPKQQPLRESEPARSGPATS